MYMLNSVVSLALFAAAAIAQSTNLQFTTFPATSLVAGSPVTVTWIGGDSSAPVTITLKKGLSTDLKDVGVLTSTATGGSYTWTPDTSIANSADYALAISQGSVINYTGQFSVTGGSKAVVTTASSVSSVSKASSISSISKASSAPSVSSISSAAASNGTITSAAAASATISPSSSSNGTVSSAALSSTDSSASASGTSTLRTSSSSRTASSTGTSSSIPATGGASGLQSPIALFFGVVAAVLYLQ